MENVTDALYMAFAVLIFVLALSITMSSFSIARVAASSIVENQDRENDYTYVKYEDENGNLETNRIVGKETIIPTLYRAYAENYMVRFFDKNGDPIPLYQYRTIDEDGNINYLTPNIIDFKNYGNGIANKKQANVFITALINDQIGELVERNRPTGHFTFFEGLGGLSNRKFSDIISSKTFIETLGIYYMEDLQYNKTDDVNKTEKRVITFTEQY